MTVAKRVSEGINRRRAIFVVLPFLFLGLANAVKLVFWGLDPLLTLMVLLPVVFFTVLCWLAFESEFARGDAE